MKYLSQVRISRVEDDRNLYRMQKNKTNQPHFDQCKYSQNDMKENRILENMGNFEQQKELLNSNLSGDVEISAKLKNNGTAGALELSHFFKIPTKTALIIYAKNIHCPKIGSFERKNLNRQRQYRGIQIDFWFETFEMGSPIFRKLLPAYDEI